MMIRLYVRSGKRSKAIIYYNTFRNRLAGGLGIEPSEKLRKAYEEIKAASAELSEKDVAGRMSRKEKSRQRTIKKRKREQDEIHVVSDCIGQIKYFWMADVVSKLSICNLFTCSSYLDENQLQALAYIEPEIAGEMEAYPACLIPDVRVARAFIRLIIAVCQEWKLIIEIHDKENMDDVSRLAFEYLLNEKIDTLHFL